MAYEAIVIAIGGIVVAALVYWAQVDRRARERKAADREGRLQTFVTAYRHRYSQKAGLNFLASAGVLGLASDGEIRAACGEIQALSGKHPIPGVYTKHLEEVDLKRFFEEFQKRGQAMTRDRAVRDLVYELGGTRQDAQHVAAGDGHRFAACAPQPGVGGIHLTPKPGCF